MQKNIYRGKQWKITAKIFIEGFFIGKNNVLTRKNE